MIAAHLKLALAFSQMQCSLVKAMFLKKLQVALALILRAVCDLMRVYLVVFVLFLLLFPLLRAKGQFNRGSWR